jgi:ABC-2 type transport system permease protein/oleandomycin transport system permease protein
MFVLLFTFVFGGAIQTGTGNYIDFLLPGILVQTVLFGSSNTGIGLAEDLASGLVERYRSLPMARSAVIAGRILADTVRNVFVVLLMIGVGYALGFRFHGGLGFAVAVVATAVAFGHAFSWISAFIGVSVRDVETAQVAGFVWLFPLTFVSSAFVPVATMPEWLQAAAELNPVTVTVNAMRGMALGFGEVWGNLWQTAAWTAGILGVFATLAIARYRRLS